MTADERWGPTVGAVPIPLDALLAAGVGREVRYRAPRWPVPTDHQDQEERMTVVEESTAAAAATEEPEASEVVGERVLRWDPQTRYRQLAEEEPEAGEVVGEWVLRWDPQAPLYGHVAVDAPGLAQPRFVRFRDLTDPLVQGLMSSEGTQLTSDGWCERRWPARADDRVA